MLHASFMTGNIMKSELLDSAVRFKRMSKGSPVANGTTTAEDEESMVRQATLAAAFHDHISCAKPPADFCKLREEGRDERAALPCETDHIYANSSDAKTATKDQEAQQLKEMLLLQLELIQHQQEQLLKKDRQLQVANQEKEALKTRLERMERRLALMKHRQEERSDDESAQETNQSSLSGSNLSRSNSSSSTSGTTNNRAEKCLSPFLSSGLKRGETRERAAVRSIKRRYASQSRTAAKRHFASLSKARSSSSSCQPKEKSSRSRSSSRESSNASVQNRRTSSTSWTPRRSKGSSPRGKEAALRKQPENILRTDKLYYTPVGDSWKSLESLCKEIVIEVPSWRHHPVTSCYQLEGTENIDDEVFAKRHFKLEVDERRRKRWDIQRIREQRQNEKLRKGRRGDKDREEDGRRWNGDIRSFYPDPKGVHFVEIANTVPVVAFGTPLPKFQPCEFSLPWFDIAAREKREAQQQKPGKQRSYSGTRRGT